MTEDRLRDIRRAGKEMFSTRGYNGTSMREIGAAVGLNIATLYHYHRDKQALFFDVVSSELQRLSDGIDRAITEGGAPPDRLRRVIHWIVEYNASSAGMTLTSELRFMDDEYRESIVALRDQMQRKVEDVVREGIEEGSFALRDRKLSAYLLFAIGYSVSMWYQPGGRLSAEDIGEVFADLVLGGLANDRTDRPAAAVAESTPTAARR